MFSKKFYICLMTLDCMSCKKRGQLTLFVIFSVVIVVVVVGWFVFQDNFVGVEVAEVSYVRNSLLNCFEDNYEGIIDDLGVRGDDDYFYDSGEVLLGELGEFEEELEGFFDVGILNCIYFYNESYDGVSLFYDGGDVGVVIEDEVVRVVVDLDLFVNVSGVVYMIEFEKSPILIDSDLKSMYEVSMFFVNYLRDNDEWIPLSMSVGMTDEFDLEFSYEEFFDESEVVVSLVSENERYPHEFRFYNKFRYDYPSMGMLL
jgi:hypothetical protein